MQSETNTQINGSSSSKKIHSDSKQSRRRKIRCIQDFDHLNRSSLSLSVHKHTSSTENIKTKKQNKLDFLPKIDFNKKTPEGGHNVNNVKMSDRIALNTEDTDSPANILKVKNSLKLQDSFNWHEASLSISNFKDEDIEFKPRFMKGTFKSDMTLRKKNQVEVTKANDSLAEFVYLEQTCSSEKDKIDKLSQLNLRKSGNFDIPNKENVQNETVSNTQKKKSLKGRASIKQIKVLRNSLPRLSQKNSKSSSESLKSFFLDLSPDTFGSTQGLFNVTCPFKENSNDKSLLSLSFLENELEKKDAFQQCELDMPCTKNQLMDNDSTAKGLNFNAVSVQSEPNFTSCKNQTVEPKFNGEVVQKCDGKINCNDTKQSFGASRQVENDVELEIYDDTSRKGNNTISEVKHLSTQGLPLVCFENNTDEVNQTTKTVKGNETIDYIQLPKDAPCCKTTKEVLECTKTVDSPKFSNKKKFSSKMSVINLLTPSPRRTKSLNTSISTPTPTKFTPDDKVVTIKTVNIPPLDRSLTFIKESVETNEKNVSPKNIDADNSLNQCRAGLRKRWTRSLRVSLMDKTGDVQLIAPPSLNTPYSNPQFSQKKLRPFSKESTLSTPKFLAASTPYSAAQNCKKVIKSSNKKALEDKSIKKTKMPNFAQIHQRAFDKLENIKEMSERKAARAKQLLAGHKPEIGIKKKSPFKSRRELHYSPPVKRQPVQVDNIKMKTNIPICENKLPMKTKSPGKKCILKPGFISKANNAQQDRLKTLAKKNPIVTETTEKRRKVIQNVRTNRRFELLMQMRKK